MKLISKIILVVIVVHAFVYASLHYFDIIQKSDNIFESLTIPLILLMYLVESEAIKLSYVFTMVVIFIGDILNSLLVDKQDFSIILYAIGLLGYSYSIFSRIDVYNMWRMLRISSIYIVCYLLVYNGVMVYLDRVSFEVVMLYNFFLGTFCILAFYIFLQRRSKTNFIILAGAVAMITVTLFYCADIFLPYNTLISVYGLEISFMVAHLTVSLFILKSEKDHLRVNEKVV